MTPQKPVSTTKLERAKLRPRVQLNLRLAGDTFVQGQTISGQLIVYVRRAEFPVRLANNKLRIIGFECLTDNPTFEVFFHHSCPFDEISYASEQIFSESPECSDEEGYREAREGIHMLPFEVTLPEDSSCGKPKGVIDVRGAAVRYIVMAYAQGSFYPDMADTVSQFSQYKGSRYKSAVTGPLLPRVFDLALAVYP